jgi:tetratricopeptide (TPR) repeat protein
LHGITKECHELKKHEEAILCFDELIRLEPEHSSGWLNKGDSLKKLGKHEEAEQCFAKAKELDES